MSGLKKNCPFHFHKDITEFDALDPEIRENPWPYYKWLYRDPKRRVYKLPNEEGFYLLHRYEDVKRAFMDDACFSSEIIPTRHAVFLNFHEGAEHRRLKNIFSDFLSTKEGTTLDKIVQQASKKAIEQIRYKGEVDVMREWASFIPLNCLSAMYGMKSDSHSISELHEKLIAINRALFVLGGTGPRGSSYPNWKEKLKISMAVFSNSGKLLRLLLKLRLNGIRELINGLRKKGGDMTAPRPCFEKMPLAISPMLDLLLMLCDSLNSGQNAIADSPKSKLIKAIKNGEATFVEVLTNSFFLFLVGYETSAGLLSNGFSHLSENPQLRDLIRQQPEMLDSLMEESMRHEAPHGRFLRRTKKNVIIGDEEIPAGSIVILLTAAANRDESVFKNADAFDLERSNNSQHLSFGKGAHACIGAALARLQWKTAITDLVYETKVIRINIDRSSSMVTDRDIGIYKRQHLYAIVD